MTEKSCRLVTWNVAWKRARGRDGSEIRRRIDAFSPDIICITEGHLDFLPDSGHLIAADLDYGCPLKEGRRKVLLWSRFAWAQIDQTGDPSMPSGRFVGGITETGVGLLRVLGVCIPWSHAHVTSGRKNRQAWEDHIAYLGGIARLLPRYNLLGQTLLTGDFNQTIPRTRAPKRVYSELTKALGDGFTLATDGLIPAVDKQAIDHVAHTSDLRVDGVQGIPNMGGDGKALSDHFGLAVDVRRACRKPIMQA